MSAEHELTESWKLIPKLQQEASIRGNTLSEQANWLSSRIDERISRNKNGWTGEQKEEILAEFSLLSEIYSVIDFDRMVEVREKFQESFPEHFTEYLKGLESLAWQVSWPGCLECSHFGHVTGMCELGVSPTSLPGGRRSLDKACKLKENRLKAA